MDLLNVGDRVITVSGSPGTVMEVTDTNARVEFDDGKPFGWYGRDEHHYDGGVLKLL